MDLDKVINGLNRALSYEYASVIQLSQHTYFMQGLERAAFADMLREHAGASLKHAQEIGDKIVTLGGVPTVEVAKISQSTDTTELLMQNLTQHHDVIAHLDGLLEDVTGDTPLRVMVEEMIYEEQQFAEELERALGLREINVLEKEVELRKVVGA